MHRIASYKFKRSRSSEQYYSLQTNPFDQVKAKKLQSFIAFFFEFSPLCAPPLGGWFVPETAEDGDGHVSEAEDSWASLGGCLWVRGRL